MIMMMLNLFDSHTHSDNSPDGEHSVTFLCEKAVENGLMGFAVTDHCECDKYERDSYEQRMLHSAFEVKKAWLTFAGQLALSLGIELGQPLSSPDSARRVLGMEKYDMVLLSVHTIRGEEDAYSRDFKNETEEACAQYLERYFDEVLETVRWDDYDILAHLTYPVRYIEGRDGKKCDLSRYKTRIDEILSTLARQGKALELNTSGLYDSFGRTSPDIPVLARFRELGGRYVTIGSDAHSAYDIGGGVEEGMRILQQCGFDYLTFYRRREARMLEIM